VPSFASRASISAFTAARRASAAAVAARHADLFPALPMFGIDAFGGWRRAQAVHFADGGVFDRIVAHR